MLPNHSIDNAAYLPACYANEHPTDYLYKIITYVEGIQHLCAMHPRDNDAELSVEAVHALFSTVEDKLRALDALIQKCSSGGTERGITKHH